MDWRERRDKALREATLFGDWTIFYLDTPWQAANYARQAAHAALSAMAFTDAWSDGFDTAKRAADEAIADATAEARMRDRD